MLLIQCLASLPSQRANLLIELLKETFLVGGLTENFVSQPVSLLIPPVAAVPASVHFMFFPPNLVQPMHKHPGDRQLLLVTSSSLEVRYTEFGNAPLAEAMKIETINSNSMATIVIDEGIWHQFSVAADGMGAVAFSFHPLDVGDPEVEFAQPNLMERLTVFLDGGNA